jgi:hypothetical protein
MARGRKKGTTKTGGRQKGTPNKITLDLKEMIEGALQAAGGCEYLTAQAKKHPAAFMALLGKILPRDIKVSGEVRHTLESLIARSFEPIDQRDSQPGSRPH